MSDDELDAIEARAKAMPPGPYEVRGDGRERYLTAQGNTLADRLLPHEAAYFAAVEPGVVLALIAEIRRLRAADGGGEG